MVENKETAADDFINIIQTQNLKHYRLEDIQTHWTDCLASIQNLHKQSKQIMIHIRGGLSFKDSNKILKSLLQAGISFKIYGRKSLNAETISANCTILIVSHVI